MNKDFDYKVILAVGVVFVSSIFTLEKCNMELSLKKGNDEISIRKNLAIKN